MHVRKTDSGLEVWAPAKLNLFLEVLARRDDGFHEIETLMCPINLYDTLYFCPDPSGRVSLTCRWAVAGEQGAPEQETLPEGTANTVVRACELLRRRAGVSLGARLNLVKRIPTAAGLAGGSSDAAAALLAANQGWATQPFPAGTRRSRGGSRQRRAVLPRPRSSHLPRPRRTDRARQRTRIVALCGGQTTGCD